MVFSRTIVLVQTTSATAFPRTEVDGYSSRDSVPCIDQITDLSSKFCSQVMGLAGQVPSTRVNAVSDLPIQGFPVVDAKALVKVRRSYLYCVALGYCVKANSGDVA